MGRKRYVSHEAVSDVIKRLMLAMAAVVADPVGERLRVRLDLGEVRPSLAGPKRPQDRVSLPNVAQAFSDFLVTEFEQKIAELGAENIACFIAEPAQASGGTWSRPQRRRSARSRYGRC